MAALIVQNVIIPMLILAYVSPRIISRLRRKNVVTGADRTPAFFQLARRNIIRSLRLLVVGYVFSILPFNVFAFSISFRLLSVELSSQIFHCFTCMYFANTIYTPIMFGLKYRRFQEGFRQLCNWQTNINQDVMQEI